MSITLMNTDWLSNAVVQTVMYFVAQNLINFQIHMHEREKTESRAADVTMLLFSAASTGVTCFVYCVISYTMLSSQVSLFVKNRSSERQTK